jgi:MoaA/NifB/PqqE/SkfB family radical SAM enzyme
LQPGAQVSIEQGVNDFHLLRPVGQLAKIYVEATNACNLDCRTCMRNVWDEPLGKMTPATFQRVLDAAGQITPRPKIFFMGFGEPLAHAHTVEMVAQAKAIGCQVELITNGLLLTPEVSLGLIRAGLDLLWVSLDGASPASYADVRLGASLPLVLANLRSLLTVRCTSGFQHEPKPQLGIAFVAMKRNIADLPEILRIGSRLGVKHYSISNVLAHTEELFAETLYRSVIQNPSRVHDTPLPVVNLPRIDFNRDTQAALAQVLGRKFVFLQAGKEMGRAVDACQFIEQGSVQVRWDGAISPCAPLLHSHESLWNGQLRHTHAHSFGSLAERPLLDIWNDPAYTAFRQRVQNFEFSPCTFCSGCDLSTENVSDCLNNPAPTCGGCLWAQGVIQCP